MSIGPLSAIAAGMAGTPMAQTRGSEIDRAQQENSARELRAQSDKKAEMAAGIGETDGNDHEAADRDADGRRLWEFHHREADSEIAEGKPDEPHAKDPSGQSGSVLDLSG